MRNKVINQELGYKKRQSDSNVVDLREKLGRKPEQIDLFRHFVSPKNEPESQSNLIDIWDIIPKYSVPRRIQNQWRSKDGRLPIYKRSIILPNSDKCDIEIKAAAIQQPDGTFIDYYPSETEELVEDILRKIFISSERYGEHEHGTRGKSPKSLVHYTLRMIYDELKAMGKSRNMLEIRTALQILTESVMTLTINDGGAHKGSILRDMFYRDRKAYEQDGSSTCAVFFSLVVSQAIDDLKFRQYNYNWVMSHQRQLTRYLHKRLASLYINAGLEEKNKYTFDFNEVDENSGMLYHNETSRRLAQLKESIEELKKDNVISHYEEIRKTRGRKILESKFHVFPSEQFVSEMKASNSRHKSVKAMQSRRDVKRLGSARNS